MPSSLSIRCRKIEDPDADAVANLLTKSGFNSSKEFWLWCLQRLAEHQTPPGYPKYGYLLEVNNVIVGAVLLIFTAIDDNNTVKCNGSSWFVWPAFRAYGSLLIKRALSRPGITYTNLSAREHTFENLIYQGYIRYCGGHFVSVPCLSRGAARVQVEYFKAPLKPGPDLSNYESVLLADHAAYGCWSVIVTVSGNRYPFVFQIRRKYRFIRFARLIYCRDVKLFIDLAGPLGWFLAKKGIFLVLVDANGPISALCGKYRETSPKYYQGPTPPQLGDTSYSERILFNIG